MPEAAHIVDHRPALDGALKARLRRLAGRLRGYVLVEGLARLMAFLMAAAVVQFVLDYGVRGLQWSMRAALLIVVLVGGVWLLWRRVIAPLGFRVGLGEMAALVERRNPELSSLLISAVRFSRGEIGREETNSPALAAAVIARAGERAAGYDFGGVLNAPRARRFSVMIAVMLVLAALAVWLAPQMTALWFQRNVMLREVDWPKRTHLMVDLRNDELVGARGDDLVIEAAAEGIQPRSVELLFETVGGKRGREMMATIGSAGAYRYRYVFKNAQEEFTFHLRGGDDRTREFRARLLERPRVARSEMRVIPPAYTQQEPLVLGDGQRAAAVLPGSQVTIEVETNKPVVEARLMSGSEFVGEARRENERLRATVAPAETQLYHFHLVDEFGLEDRQPARFSVRITKDEPPHARLRIPMVGAMITPEAVLPIDLEFTDGYGLASAELTYRLMREGGPTEGGIELPDFVPRSTSFARSLAWPVARISASPGEGLVLSARASDFDDVSGPNVGESAPISLRVVTPDELLAELARREQEYRLDFERLLDAQEQVRGALLTVLAKFGGSAASGEEFVAMLAPLERRQRNIVGSVNAVRQQFEQILNELRVNGLGSSAAEQRLGGGIVRPLTDLAKRDLVEAADLIRRWSRDGSAETAGQIDPKEAALLLQMRAVLANMIQWEGYQEAVNLLRDILRMQSELETETKRTLEEQGADVFDK